MKSMYEISKEAIELASYLEEGELTPEIENALSINQSQLQEKSINYGYVIKTIDADLSAIDEEIKRLQGLKKAKQGVLDKMKEAVKNAMELYGMEKIETPTMKLSFRKSDSVEIINEGQIPSDFKTYRVVESVDKVAVKKAIKNGKNVPGATLIENNNLQIK